MRPTDQTKRHVIENYVEPARNRGENKVRLRIGTVIKELGWRNRTPSVYSTLTSEEFQRQAGIRLVDKSGGPASGGPSTTWDLTYRILDDPSPSRPRIKAGLLGLSGICADMYRRVGGAEAFIRALRDDFGSVASDSADDTRGKTA